MMTPSDLDGHVRPRRGAAVAGLAAAAARRLGVAARSGLRSAPLRHAAFALFVAGVLAYGAAFAWHMLDRSDLVDLLHHLNCDDSFYYFQIAWHMAGGEFSTFDGGLTRTNGYHPLWLLLITPFYQVFDKTEALFAIKAFEVMLVAGGVALVAGAARAARLPWILLLAVLPALYQIPAMFLGMEAAAALFMLGLFLLAVCLFARAPARWRWPLAAVAFALPWVRLEYVAVAMAATTALCLVEWSDRLPASDFSPARRGGWRGWGRSVLALNAAAPLSGAVAGILAYFAWNGVVFGGFVPATDAVRQRWSQDLWERTGGYSLTENFHAHLRFFDDELLVALEVCVYVVVVWWFSRRSRGRDDWLLLAFLVGVFGLAAGHLAKFAHGVLTVHPRWGTYEWYFVPAYLTGALAFPARCCVAVWFVRRFVEPELRRGFRRIPSLWIVVIGAAHLLGTTDFNAPFQFHFFDRQREATTWSWSDSSYMGTMVMNRLLPEGSVVGTIDSGVAAYFSRFPVMNMEGMVSSWDHLRAIQAGTAHEFRQRYGITYMAAMQAPPSQRDRVLLESPHTHVHRPRQFKLWVRASWDRVDRATWVWERLEPHLERRADGVGFLVGGRLAQAFVRDCAPDELAVWSWGADREGGGGTVLVPWTQMATGLCTSGIVLPHGALPPVRAMTSGGYPDPIDPDDLAGPRRSPPRLRRAPPRELERVLPAEQARRRLAGRRGVAPPAPASHPGRRQNRKSRLNLTTKPRLRRSQPRSGRNPPVTSRSSV